MPCPEHEVGSTMSNLGAVVWLTGLSGAGKSTIAARLAAELSERGIPVELLDGDEVRTHVSAGLGFSRAERDANVRRIGWIAATLAKHGVVAITALEFGQPLDALIVRLPLLVAGALLLLLAADATLRVWRSAWAWLPVDRGRGLFRFVWAGVLLLIPLATAGGLLFVVSA
jgi:hypothetical protein